MKNVILLFALVFSISTNAQSLSDLFNRKKNEILQKAQNKIENKIDNKIDQTMNKGLNGIDNAVSGKKSEKRRNSENADSYERSAPNEQSQESTGNTMTSELIISSNVHCQEGSDLLEELIRGKNGVMSVSIDIEKGKIYVSMDKNNADLKKEILNTITDNGFSANGKNPKTKSTLCK